jgi:hypothetical protein
VANPRKVLSSLAAGTNYWHEKTTFPKMCKSVGMCGVALWRGVPVLQAYSQALCRGGTTITPEIYYTDLFMKASKELRGKSLHRVEPEVVELSTRLSFERAFNISVQEQLAMEKRLESWIPVYNNRTVPQENCGWEFDYSPYWDPERL